MADRNSVVELKATAALLLDVPKEFGEALEAGIDEVLSAIPSVRTAVVEELGDVTPSDDQLRVEAYVRVTFHFAPDSTVDPVEAARHCLGDAATVGSVRAFDVRDGPYRIEAW